jgi:hypothetical protein
MGGISGEALSLLTYTDLGPNQALTLACQRTMQEKV